jgi:hypothetical protein
MSTRSYESESLSDHSNGHAHGLANAVSAVSNVAHQTAGQVGRTFDYVFSKGSRLREGAATVARTASQHPAYAWVAIGLVAFGLGFFLRGSRANKTTSPAPPDVSPE